MTEWHDGTSLDDQLVASWYRLKAERKRNGKLVIALSWLRRYPAAWLRVVAQDTEAASIAVQRHWSLDPVPRPSEFEIAHVERAAKQAVAAITGARDAGRVVVVPLRAAAAPIPQQTKRGPPIDA